MDLTGTNVDFADVQSKSTLSSGYFSSGPSSRTSCSISEDSGSSSSAPAPIVVGKPFKYRPKNKPQNFDSAKFGRRMKSAGLVECHYCVQWFLPEGFKEHQNNCPMNMAYLARKKEFQKNFKPKVSQVVHYEKSASKLTNNGIIWEYGKGFQKQNFMRKS